MRFSYLIFICTLIFSSCGRDYKASRSPASTIGQVLQGSSTLDGDQKSIAYNICFELMNKNMAWRQNLLNKTFLFDVEETACESEVRLKKMVSTTLKQSLNSSPMSYDPSPNNSVPFSQVITHLHGPLANVCSAVLKGVATSNTTDLSDGSKASYTFFKKSDNGFDGFKVEYTETGSSTIVKNVVYQVALNAAGLPSSDHKGIELSVESTTACENSISVATKKQTFQP
ncbi:MAG: hypothetical protein CME71_01470 [Halobacteriovorax sp.]|nr:hypothetical protein [Halobacteriovorax sp.]